VTVTTVDTTADPDRIVLAVTGASGTPIAVRTAEELAEHVEVIAVVSDAAEAVMAHETDDPEAARERLETAASSVYGEEALAAPIASGSTSTDGMVVAPCSMNTLSGIAHGRGDTLITRAADVTLKERRRLVVVPREIPLDQRHLENMQALAAQGVDVVPPMLGFYFDPETVEDLVDHVVGKVLERFDLEHDLYDSWGDSA
jgi:4-hydroxy-3-polyprenylbenzoate decarboxylase